MSRYDDIEVFVRIAQTGSISRAAEQLGVAKSAVSRRLADLETRLGVQLINRTTRRLALTDPGATFFRKATLLLDGLHEAEAEAREGQTELVGRLKIAAPLSFGLKHLAPMLSDFAKRHPRIVLDLDFSDRRIDLIEENFDLAVRIGALADSSLIARKLCPVRLAVAAAPSFWRDHGKPNHPSDLKELPLLRYSLLDGPAQVRYWGPGGDIGVVNGRVHMWANNGEFLTTMARAGHGYVVEPTFFLADDFTAGTLELVLKNYAFANMNLYAVYPPARHVSARVRAFIDALAERFRQNPYWDEVIFQ